MRRDSLQRTIIAAAALLAGCVAPIGIGPGPTRLPAGHGVKGNVSGSAGYGAGASRDQFQAEANARVKLASFFALGTGLVYNTVRDRDGEREVVLSSAMPYVRPSFHYDRVSLGVALSGLGMGGGGGGAAYGLIEPRLGVGGDAWAVYVSWLRHGSTAVGGSTIEVSSEHWRVGGDYYFGARGTRFGIAAEITRGDDSIHYSPSEGSSRVGGTWEERYTMGSVKLRVMSGAF